MSFFFLAQSKENMKTASQLINIKIVHQIKRGPINMQGKKKNRHKKGNDIIERTPADSHDFVNKVNKSFKVPLW